VYLKREVTLVIKNTEFELVTSQREKYFSRTIIISTGLKDVLPNIENISDFYGCSRTDFLDSLYLDLIIS